MAYGQKASSCDFCFIFVQQLRYIGYTSCMYCSLIDITTIICTKFVTVLHHECNVEIMSFITYFRFSVSGDTLACTVVLFHVTEFYRVTWPLLWRSDIQCAVHRTFRFLGFDVTVFTMVAIAIDR